MPVSSASPPPTPPRRLFRLRTILMVVLFAVVLLPLVSLYFFRFYENELVRKTETELISQSAVISAIYRDFINQGKNILPVTRDSPSSPYYTPVTSQLDLSYHSVLPRRPISIAATLPINPAAKETGERLKNILINTQRITLAGFRVLDINGTVVAGSIEEQGLSLAHIPEVSRAMKGHYTSVIRQRISDEPQPPIASISRGTGIRIFTAFPIKDEARFYGVVYLSRTPQNIIKFIYERKRKVAMLSLLLLSITLAIVFFISYHLVRPIRELTEQTRKVTSGETDTIDILTKPGTYELAQLSDSFKKMSIALNERSNYIRQFASHVSHEFKTPLTSMQGALELLQEHFETMPSKQRKKFINNLSEDTERMKRLVNRLLELAHADSLQGSNQATTLMPLLERMESHYREKGLQLIIKPQDQDITINIAEEALETVLGNLLENSLQHGANKVQLDIQANTKDIQLLLHDNGKGISTANQKHIFTPFFTTKRENGGTGLGLDIVASLLKAWGGNIKLEPSTTGALFRIKLQQALSTKITP